MSVPIVSVFVVNWNSGNYLRAALVALARQTLREFEVIVVDNASADNSQKCVLNFADSRFTLVQLEHNVGFAAANNIAAARAKSLQFFALLNPDAFPEISWLERLVCAADIEFTYAAFSSSLVSSRNTDLWDGTGDCYRITGQPFRRDHQKNRAKYPRRKAEVFSPCAAAALYTREAWLAVDGMDEDYFCYIEDVDLGFRLQLLGYKTLHIPEAVCLHVGSGVVGVKSDFATYYGQRNLSLAFLKNMPSVLLALLMPLHLMSVIAAFFLFVLRGQGQVFLKSKIAAVRLVPKFWKKRRPLQKLRILSSYQVWLILDKSVW